VVNILTAPKTDFFIVPFALFYVYTVFTASFNLPRISQQEFLLFDLLPSFVSQEEDIYRRLLMQLASRHCRHLGRQPAGHFGPCGNFG
jgi:hypothetical protein